MIENPVNIETHKAGHKIILREPKPFADFVELVVETCAYAGSGNVLKVQKMLHLCAEHKKGDDANSMH